MKKKMDDFLPPARFANSFMTEGRISLKSAPEWLIFMHGVTQLDPYSDEELPQIEIPITNLKSVLQHNKQRSGSFYERVKKTVRGMVSANWETDSDVYIEGKPLPTILNFYSGITAKKNKLGTECVIMRFNPEMKPVLLELRKNFVSLQVPVNMHSGHAIRFYAYAQAERDKRRKHDGKTTVLRFNIEDFRKKMLVEGKYKQIKDFKKRVIEPIQEGVNKSLTLRIREVIYEKTGRKITHILFFVEDANPTKALQSGSTESKKKTNTEPTPQELSALTFSQEKAYKYLVSEGIFSGIAVRKMIPLTLSSECVGYEDYQWKEVFKIAREKSKADSDNIAGVVVDWVKKDIFKNDHFSRILEDTIQRKKSLAQEVRDNRETAKKMTAIEFKKWHKQQQQRDTTETPTQEPKNDTTTEKENTGGFAGMGSLLKSLFKGK